MLYYYYDEDDDMKQLVIKIGGDMKGDIKQVFDNPKTAQKNSHTLYLKNSEDLYEILSPKRLELLRYIINHQIDKKTISELAEELERKQEAISRDANLLVKYNLIEKIREKQMVYLKAIYNSLQIRLASGS
jgi:predicted transcriptional regulator